MTLSLREIRLLLLSGILLYLSFPYFPTGILSLVSLIPVFILLEDIPSPKTRQFFYLGYKFGVVFSAFTLYWLANNILILAILVVFLNAFFYGFLFWVFGFMRRTAGMKAYYLFPFWWTVFEYGRELTDLKFNWTNLAHTFTYYIPVIQFIEYTGYLGISFLIVLTNVLLFLGWKQGKRSLKIHLLLIGGVWIWLIIFGLWKFSEWKHRIPNMPTIKASYVQPNIDPWLKWEPELQQMSIDTLYRKTNDLLAHRPHLIVWPETATPFYLRQRWDVIRKIQRFCSENTLYFVTGTLDFERDDDSKSDYRTFNSAFFFSPDRNGWEKYDKIHLVPGAEGIPFRKVLEPLADRINLGQGSFSYGKKPTVFMMNKESLTDVDPELPSRIGFGVAICYDSVFPDLFRNFEKNGANFFVIITNDGWFGLTTGPFQHKQYAVLRAIEFRKSIVRCANTGISCFIDPAGQSWQDSRLERTAIATHPIAVSQESTFFADNGPVIVYISTVVLIVGMIFLRLKKDRNEKIDGHSVSPSSGLSLLRSE